jgi:hypothetical protein
VQVGNDSTDNRTPQVTSVERLGNVGRRKVDEHVFAFTLLGGSVGGSLGFWVLLGGFGGMRDGSKEVVGEALSAAT